jgi:hypothetical protein
MQLLDSSEKFKEFFLLTFTKQLIMHSFPGGIYKLQEELEKTKQKKKVKQIIKKDIQIKPLERTFKLLPKPIIPRQLIIPRSKFPQRLQYLTPIPKKLELNLEKLNPLIKDPKVRTIECYGPEQQIIVSVPNKRKTGIKLTKQEIDEIIEIFSKQSRIPIEPGVFRVVVGELELSAIISEITGSKFIITKLH